jgi:predicted RNA binding protein YcfA (HicA-like mRNA interferase family)
MTSGIKPTTYQVQMKVFEEVGCRYVRTQGDHLVYHFPGANRPVVIPKYKEVPVFIIRNNMRVIGLTVDKYLSILKKV